MYLPQSPSLVRRGRDWLLKKEFNMDRRKALMTIGISSLTIPQLISCKEEEHEEIHVKGDVNDDGLVDLLFVQEAQNVQFKDNQMILIDVDPKTLFFADRPDEVAGYLFYK